MKIRIEYDPAPIRHIAVQCPKCENWFDGRDIADSDLAYEYQIYTAQFHCPVCDKIFGSDARWDHVNVHIEEVDYPKVYEGCLQRKEIWE